MSCSFSSGIDLYMDKFILDCYRIPFLCSFFSSKYSSNHSFTYVVLYLYKYQIIIFSISLVLKEGSCLDRLSVLMQCSGFSLIPSPSTLRSGSASHGAPGPLRGVPGPPVGFLHQEGGANSPGCVGFPASFSLSRCRMTLGALS